MKVTFFFLLLLLPTLTLAQTDRAGIGTTTPRAGLDVTHNDGIVATGQGPDDFDRPGPGNVANLPTGPGTRLLWVPAKVAFRAGYVPGGQWNFESLGLYSVAMGVGTTASGSFSTALGTNTTASGNQSTALGLNTAASGQGATAFGQSTTASGDYSTALGNTVSTNGQLGSLAVGDLSTETTLLSSATNQWSSRFAGGYRFFTNAATSRGLFVSEAGLLATGQGPTLSGGLPDPAVPADLPTGAGTRLLWIPKKAAFRVGTVGGDHWDYANVGAFSVALGSNNRANGLNALAFGSDNTASGNNTVAMGAFATASGSYAHAAGLYATASGAFSRAEGSYVSTDGKKGSFALGDGSPFDTSGQNLLSSADHEYSARFVGGYRLFTNAGMSQGLFLTPANRLGLGSNAPRAGLDIEHNDGLLVTGQGPTSTGTVGEGNEASLPSGAGTRLLWLSKKAAFRAGRASGGEWDYGSVGVFSVAMGNNTTAGGKAAVALGEGSSASANFALAAGKSNTASGQGAVALGNSNVAGGLNAVAIGDANTANGSGGVAIGYLSSASGAGGIAIGNNLTASGTTSIAMGTSVSTNGRTGSLIFGDVSNGDVLNNDVNNQFKAVFAGGYVLLTSRTLATSGVQIVAGGNAWSSLSDSTKKEGFRPANGAQFLQKIAGMRLGSWNYRGQDSKTFRHYGPMAQDFFAAFGQDGIGTIGCDTLINQADFDGVNLIAIKALVQENESRKAEIERLRADVDRLTALEAENQNLRRLLGEVVTDLRQLKASASPGLATRQTP